MRPCSCSTICGATARVMSHTPCRFTSKTRFRYSKLWCPTTIAAQRGVVPQDVDPTEPLDRLPDARVGGTGVRHVAVHVLHRPQVAELGSRLLPVRVV